MTGLPCMVCGPENDCTCPPCPCRWCRYARGEASPEERRVIEARDRAFRLADQRKLAREETANMRAKLDAYLAGTKH